MILQKYLDDFSLILTQSFEKLFWEWLVSLEEISSMIQEVPENIKWDFGLPCFRFSQKLEKSPNEIAKILSDFINQEYDLKQYNFDVFEVWPYLNFSIDTQSLFNFLHQDIFDKKDLFGSSNLWKQETVLVESPWPNTNKPLHLWHVRNMLLWNSLVEILKFTWYNVKRVDIINDRWIHICKSMLAYKKFWNNKTPQTENIKSDHFVWKFYVEYSKQSKEHPELEQEAKEMLIKRENNDPEVIKLWKLMNQWAIEWIHQTYQRYGCKIDKTYFESEHYKDWKEIIFDWLKKWIFTKDEKWNIVFNYTKNWKEYTKVVLRADWTAVYTTQDIALAQKRYNDFKMKKMIYVVANEQEEHFYALFEIFKALNWSFANNCYHMSYWMIFLPSWKMKSREWTVVDADNLIEEMIQKAEKIQKNKNIDIDYQNLEKIAMGAIKFFILKYWVKKNFVFYPEESLSFEWETWPYLQYTYARCNSLIKKYTDQQSEFLLEELKENNIEKLNLNLSVASTDLKKLLFSLAKFEKVIIQASKLYSPDLIAKYLFELSQEFNSYYTKNRILTDDNNLTTIQIILVLFVSQVLQNWLKLLWIDLIERM